MKFPTALSAAFLFSLTLCFFGPSQLYWTNLSYFGYFYSQLLPYSISSSVFVGVLVAFILVRLRGAFHQKAVSCIFAVGLLLWVQGNILVWNCGALDGRNIIWEDFLYRGLLDSAVWVAVIGVCFFKDAFIYRHIRLGCFLLIVVQLITLGITYTNASPQPLCKYYTVSDKNKFDFSKEKNVIILVLDAFRSDIFQEIIREDSSYADIFEGFTFFRNSVSGYPATRLSIPHMLTGQYYDNSMPFTEWKEKAYTSTSIPKQLKDEGYRADVFPFEPATLHYSSDIADNFVINESSRLAAADVGFMFDLALFRHVPIFLKQRIYDHQKWFLKQVFFKLDQRTCRPHSDRFSSEAFQQSPDIRFIDDMLKQANTNSIQPAFKFYHLSLPHRPIILNENLELARLNGTRHNYKNYAKASLRITELFLEKLKEINAFENSMIFVVSDHGVPYFQSKSANSMGLMDMRGLQSALPMGLNLFLVKPFGQSGGEVKISDAPVVLSDIACTILASESKTGCNVPQGRNVFELDESSSRKRRFLYYNYLEFSPPFFGNMIEFNISGQACEENSWNETHRMFTPNGIVDYSPAASGEERMEITFGKEGNSSIYETFGFGKQEETCTWSSTQNSLLRFCTLMVPYSTSSSPVVLKLKALPFLVKDKIPYQSVILGVNDVQMSNGWLFSKEGSQEKWTVIDPDLLQGEFLMLGFFFPDAQSLKKIGMGDDKNIQALAFEKLVIEKAVDLYDYGEEILFGIQGVAKHLDAITYQQQGWMSPEQGVTRIKGQQASMTIPVDATSSDLLLKAVLFVDTEAGAHDTQRVLIHVNGTMIGEWEITEAGICQKTSIIPNALFKDYLKVTFELSDTVSQFEGDTNESGNVFGPGFKSLIILEQRAKKAN